MTEKEPAKVCEADGEEISARRLQSLPALAAEGEVNPVGCLQSAPALAALAPGEDPELFGAVNGLDSIRDEATLDRPFTLSIPSPFLVNSPNKAPLKKGSFQSISLEKIPIPQLDLSNPFSVLENCTVIEPTSSSFY